MRLLAAFLALSLTLPALAGAQRCAPEVKVRRAYIVHEGVPGVWLDHRVADCLMDDQARMRKKIRLQDQKLNLKEDQLLDMTVSRDQAVFEAQKWKGVADEGVVQLDYCVADNEKLSATWRKPWVWTLIGIGVGLAVGVPVGMKIAEGGNDDGT